MHPRCATLQNVVLSKGDDTYNDKVFLKGCQLEKATNLQ